MPVPRSSLFRFLIAGSATVGVDAVSYAALIAVGMPIDPAKAIGFATGTAFAYFVNRHWTFGVSHGGIRQIAGFVTLYLSSLLLNVGVNFGVLKVIGTEPHHLTLAWFVATGASATWNYAGMRWLVFKQPDSLATADRQSATNLARDRMS